jgi:hypothetical protein
MVIRKNENHIPRIALLRSCLATTEFGTGVISARTDGAKTIPVVAKRSRK